MRHHTLIVWTLAAAVATALAAGSAPAATGSGAGPAAPALDKLSVAIIAPNANFAPVFVAKSSGIFEKHNLDVDIVENAGANTLNFLVSGRADVTLFATPNSILLASRGQPTTVFMNALQDSGAALVGGPNFRSIASLGALGNRCSITTTQPGTQGYGYAYFYTHTDKLPLRNCNLEPAPSNAVAVARLASGQVSAAVLPLSFAITFVNEIGAHLLVSPNLPSYRRQFGLPTFSSSVYFGLTSVVQSKRPQIINFIKAINETNRMLVPRNLTRLTQLLKPFDSFKAVDDKELRTSLQFIISYMGPGANYASPAAIKRFPKRMTSNPGYIPQAVWNRSLRQYAQWGIPGFDAEAAASRYGARVNMSYLSAALGSKR
jgi:ABC-type nitrate/sulfonate/bicarbonate transport system substrate-binding protein